jgi:hypothetical protein
VVVEYRSKEARMKKQMITVIDDTTGAVLAEIEVPGFGLPTKLGAWMAKNRMVVVQWLPSSVTVRPA